MIHFFQMSITELQAERIRLDEVILRLRAELRSKWVDELGMTLNLGADRFWAWVHASNACIDDCPRRRSEHLDFVKRHFKLEEVSHDSIASIFRGTFKSQWDGRRCIDTAHCVMCDPGLSSVKESIELLNTHRLHASTGSRGDATDQPSDA